MFVIFVFQELPYFHNNKLTSLGHVGVFAKLKFLFFFCKLKSFSPDGCVAYTETPDAGAQCY